MEKTKDIVKRIMECGSAKVEDLVELKKVLFADGVISEQEAQFVKEMNYDILRRCWNDETFNVWKDTFVEIVTSFVLDDEKSKGFVDEKEAAWLANLIKTDAKILEVEKALVANLAAKTDLPAVLKELL